MQDQLSLQLGLRDEATFESFYLGENNHLLEYLKDFVVGLREQVVYTWGENGVGKTHLQHACCHRASTFELTSIYIPLKNHQEMAPNILEGLENYDLVCLDDVADISHKREWEETLFHLYNKIVSTNNRLFLTGNQSPRQLKLSLADLHSRLNGAITFQIKTLDDKEKLKALQIHAKNRGFSFPEDTAEFIINRCSRNMVDLIRVLDTLDKSSLAKQRKLTIPFVKSILKL